MGKLGGLLRGGGEGVGVEAITGIALPISLWALAFGVVLLAASLQATVGFGFALVSVPLLSMLDPRLAPVPQLLLDLLLSAAVCFRERSDVDLRGVTWVVFGRIPGSLLGLLCLKLFSQEKMSVAIGLCVLGAVLILSGKRRLKRSLRVDLFAGTLSGLSAVVASIGGPPLALIFVGERAARLRATLAAIYCIGIVVAIVVRAAGGELLSSDVSIALVFSPVLLLAMPISAALKTKISDKALGKVILLIAAGAGLTLLLRPLW